MHKGPADPPNLMSKIPRMDSGMQEARKRNGKRSDPSGTLVSSSPAFLNLPEADASDTESSWAAAIGPQSVAISVFEA
jgi:hypothetical protein